MIVVRALIGMLLTTGAAAAKPQPQLQPMPLGRFDDQLIAEAIRATVAEMPKMKEAQGSADFGAAAGPEARRKIDRAFEAAAVPECYRANALKHAPPVIRVAGVPIVLGGLLALPHLAYAASTGKCK